MFGAVNALFSGLALAGIIYTILLQQHELKMQRKELELTRGELAGQKEQFRIQNETLRMQKFESTLFHLLSLRRDTIASISDVNEEKSIFTIAVNFINRHTIERVPGEMAGRSIQSFQIHWQSVGTYFRERFDFDVVYKNLNVICDLVESMRKKHEIVFYANIVRAHLAPDEQRILIYEIFRNEDPLSVMPKVERLALIDETLLLEEPFAYFKEQARERAQSVLGPS